MTRISRTQAWCKLVILIAEGLPAPRGISFHPDLPLITISPDDTAALHAWAEQFDATLNGPRYHAGYWTTSGDAARHAWHGYSVSLHYYEAGEPPTSEPVTEDMSQVREIAGAVSCERVGLHNNCSTMGGWRNHSNADHSPDAGSTMTAGAVSE